MPQHRGFTIHELIGDNKFECISNEIPPIHLNIVARDTHVPDAENSAKVMTERIRCILNAPPYPRVPKLLFKVNTIPIFLYRANHTIFKIVGNR